MSAQDLYSRKKITRRTVESAVPLKFVGGAPVSSDFDDFTTEFWYSLHPNASRISSVSLGSGVSQITGVNSGTARNATQSTGSMQYIYDPTGLNGFPCCKSNGGISCLNTPQIDLDGCAILQVCQVAPNNYTGNGFSVVAGNNFYGDYLAGSYLNTQTGNLTLGNVIGSYLSFAETEVASMPTQLGVACWRFADIGVYSSWNGGAEAFTLLFDSPIITTLTLIASSISSPATFLPRWGEFVVLSAADSTPENIAQGINILKFRWGIM